MVLIITKNGAYKVLFYFNAVLKIHGKNRVLVSFHQTDTKEVEAITSGAILRTRWELKAFEEELSEISKVTSSLR